MHDLSQVTLLQITDDHFAHLLGEPAPLVHFSQPPGGLDSPGMLQMLRRMVARLHAAGSFGHWLILDANEAVGLCGYTASPSEQKTVEIGYGIARERRNRGYATKAVSLLLEQARADSAVSVLLAETALNNPASKITLQRNGFTHAGTRDDKEDGPLDMWKFDLT